MHILNSCVFSNNRSCKRWCAPASPAARFLCSTARIQQDISAASFCSRKLLWCSDECVLLPRFNAQLDIFAVINCCVVGRCVRAGRCVQKNMHIMSTNFAKTLVWKHEYDVKLWRHKQRTLNTNDHHMPLNETPHEDFLRTPLQVRIVKLWVNCSVVWCTVLFLFVTEIAMNREVQTRPQCHNN